MLKIEFTLDTDLGRFEDVLRDLTRNRFRPYGWTGAPGNADDRVLYPASDLRLAAHVRRRRKLYQEFQYQKSWTVKDDGETEETLSPPRRGVEYELLDKSADRTGVTANLLEPRLFEPFALVLLDIAGEYEEARTSIRQQLGLFPVPAGNDSDDGPARLVRPHTQTEELCKELVRFREERLTSGGRLPPVTEACKTVGIDRQTAKKHVPRVYNQWKIKGVRWDPNGWDFLG